MRRCLSLLLGLALLRAGAASAEAAVPAVDAQRFDPSSDATWTLWLDDSTLAPALVPSARLVLHHADDPLLAVAPDGSQVPVLDRVTELDALVGLTLWRVRAALRAPVILGAGSEVAAGGAGLGDLGLDLKLSLRDGSRLPLGLAATLRGTLPTTTLALPLGAPGGTAELGLVVDQRWDHLLLGLHPGLRLQPESDLGGVTIGDELLLRAGAAWAPGHRAGLSAEVAAAVQLHDPWAASTAAELLMGGWTRVGGPLTLRAGIGRGLSDGIGAPRWRGVLALDYRSLRRSVEPVPMPLVEEPAPPPEAAPAPPPASEPAIPVEAPPAFHIQPDDASVWLAHPYCIRSEGGEIDAALHEVPVGTPLTVTAPGYLPAFVELRPGLEVVLVEAPSQGALVVLGAPGDRLEVAGQPVPLQPDGSTVLNVAEGAVRVVLTGGGRRAEQEVAVVDGHATWLRVPGATPVAVPFAVGSDRLEAEASAVIRALVERSGDWSFELQGGFSPEGDPARNRALAEARAAAVRVAMIEAGLPPERVALLEVAEPDGAVEPAQLRACWIRPVPLGGEGSGGP